MDTLDNHVGPPQTVPLRTPIVVGDGETKLGRSTDGGVHNDLSIGHETGREEKTGGCLPRQGRWKKMRLGDQKIGVPETHECQKKFERPMSDSNVLPEVI